ncbi:hypothetical protein NPX79_03555 [Spiroplasma endosymbiont of Anurida maritima]|uniref:hypothetical protein n=1 Tax=Spiroplasma endosymbiont of Anurida maritima TaxID=2967972 RepID=UPI0036D38C37
MRKAAYILSIIGTVFSGILILPLAWMIPMTIAIKKTIYDGKEHIALGICTIFFMPFGIISGILILVSKDEVETQSNTKAEVTEPTVEAQE